MKKNREGGEGCRLEQRSYIEEKKVRKLLFWFFILCRYFFFPAFGRERGEGEERKANQEKTRSVLMALMMVLGQVVLGCFG